MQIFMNGKAQKDFAPDLISANVVFSYRADSYDEALRGGVESVKEYIQQIAEGTDFTFEDFRTRTYSVREQTHINRIEPKTRADLDKNLQQIVSDGFFFSQRVSLEFDYDRERLAKLLVLSSKIPNAPHLNIDFLLKDVESKKRELIADAYEDAKKKAEALANAAQKNLRDCVRVEIDPVSRSEMYDRSPIMAKQRSSVVDIEQELQNIDDTFKPDDITISKQISCVWETSN